MHTKSYFLVAGVVLVGSFRAPAGAEPAAPFFGLPSSTGMFQRFCADEDALLKSKMAFTEAKLNLQPKQRTEWDAFVAEYSAAAQPIRTLCQGSPPTVDSDIAATLDFHQRALTVFLEMNNGFIAATKKFLVALSPEQQRVIVKSTIHPFPPIPPILFPFGPPGPTL